MEFFGSSYKTGTQLLIIIFSLIIFGCAEIGPPSGGEEDKQSPYLLFSSPANGTTNVLIDNKIELYFSERIVKPPKTQKAIFISPRPEQPPEISWKTDRIIIKTLENFKENQTYIITLGNAIKDLRNNSLDSTSIIAFSTGEVLDSGVIEGEIFEGNKPRSDFMVGLYSPDSFEDGILKDSTYPEYLAQSNRNGKFRFEYLPEKKYMMIAFEDKDKNELINLDKERLALPDRPIDLSVKNYIDNLLLPVTREDTTAMSIISAGYSVNKLVRVELSKELFREDILKSQLSLTLISLTDSTNRFYSSSFIESYMADTDQLHFYLEDLDTGMYYLELNICEKLLGFENFAVTMKEDKELPVVKAHFPEDKIHFNDKLVLESYFSEAIDTSLVSAETFSLWYSDTVRIPVICSWQNSYHIMYTVDSLTQSGVYKLKITEFEISDIAGNVMGDSLREYTFSIIDPDSMGLATGKTEVLIADKSEYPVFLSFQNYKSGQIFNLPLENKQFRIDLPSGKYFLSGFLDSNDNLIRDFGSLIPYSYSETFAGYDDTISVRARFETSDINFIIK